MQEHYFQVIQPHPSWGELLVSLLPKMALVMLTIEIILSNIFPSTWQIRNAKKLIYLKSRSQPVTNKIQGTKDPAGRVTLRCVFYMVSQNSP